MLAIIFYLSCIGLFISVSLILPIFVGMLNDDIITIQRLAAHLVLGVFLFATPVLAIVGRERQIPRTSALILVTLVWTFIPLVIATAIYDISDLSFVDSFFEAVSGITTTGSTTIDNINQQSHGLIFLRSQIQWMGGALTLITIFAVIAPLEIGGINLTTTSKTLVSGEQRILKLLTNVISVYILATFATFFLFMLTGADPFHAIGLAMAAVSTGGFLTFDNEPDTILGNSGMIIFAVISTLAATSVLWRRAFVRRNWKAVRQHRESWCVIALILILAVAFVFQIINVTAEGKNNITTTIVEGIFNGAAIVSTTGVESRTGMFSLIPLPIILFIVLVGGSTFSSAGGIKQYRIGAMISQSWYELDKLIYPNIVKQTHFGQKFYQSEKMQAIWSCIVAAIGTIIFGTTALTITGIPFDAALTATLTSFSNAGPVYNSTWVQPHWISIAEYSDSAKIILSFVMILGRLEVLAVIALFSREYWRNI